MGTIEFSTSDHAACSIQDSRTRVRPSTRRSGYVRGLFACVAAVLFLFGLASAARADDPKEKEKEKGPQYRVVDVSLIYSGNPRLFKKPCVVDADKIYKSIPEYQEIVEKNLTDRDVRYHFLMKKASDKFAKSLRGLVKDLEYDLIGGVGSIVPATTDAPAVPNGTDGAIARLPAA